MGSWDHRVRLSGRVRGWLGGAIVVACKEELFTFQLGSFIFNGRWREEEMSENKSETFPSLYLAVLLTKTTSSICSKRHGDKSQLELTLCYYFLLL